MDYIDDIEERIHRIQMEYDSLHKMVDALSKKRETLIRYKSRMEMLLSEKDGVEGGEEVEKLHKKIGFTDNALMQIEDKRKDTEERMEETEQRIRDAGKEREDLSARMENICIHINSIG